MEILSGIGGGVLALFHYLFSVAVVVLGGGSVRWRQLRRFFRGAAKSGENPLNLTKSKRSRIGFKAC